MDVEDAASATNPTLNDALDLGPGPQGRLSLNFEVLNFSQFTDYSISD